MKPTESISSNKKVLRVLDKKFQTETRIVYSNDIAYMGDIDINDIDVSKGIVMYNPLVLNIRPIVNKDDKGTEKLEAVILDMVLPIEFAGIPVADRVYTGFLNYTPARVEIVHPNISYITAPSGEKIAINRLASLADRDNPMVTLYNIARIISPSEDLINIYNIKMATYKQLLFANRIIETTVLDSGEESGSSELDNLSKTGNTVH